MSHNWPQDIAEMHTKFGVNPVIRSFDKEKLYAFLEFRVKFLQEELNEMKESDNPEDIVDACVDLCVVAIGTLNAMDVNAYAAWDEVHRANMSKEVGIKASRPNPLNLPDLIKPADFKHPNHAENIGLLSKLF